MLKVERIKLSGFRGILKPKELLFRRKEQKEPSPLVLYGLNSSGKTSFVDGLEWFLSPQNEIQWLRREDARERAYPHLEAKAGDSYVEISFRDSSGTKELNLRKTFNHKKITQPTLSSDHNFQQIYDSFVIKPYLRYFEVIDFVYNHTGVEKYQKLARWMGFGEELQFQEKISLGILPRLRQFETTLQEKTKTVEFQFSKLTSSAVANEETVLSAGNAILLKHGISKVSTQDQLWSATQGLKNKSISTPETLRFNKLGDFDVSITSMAHTSSKFAVHFQNTRDKLREFNKQHELLEKLDSIDLYDRAFAAINKTSQAKINCPVCGAEWDRDHLMDHIKGELRSLEKARDQRDELLRALRELRPLVQTERDTFKERVGKYEEAQKLVPSITFLKTSEYLAKMETMGKILTETGIPSGLENTVDDTDSANLNTELDSALKEIREEKVKCVPSPEALQIAESLATLLQIKELWQGILAAKEESEFTREQIEKFTTLSSAISKLIQQGIQSRFNEISERIGRYFGILRNDKDIKDVVLVLNLEKGKAAGRSAEIQLSYYEITVKPAYKVLSESLLNSLGLAIYFACVKQFNTQCKFIVLDDIMNSLDIDNRDTLLDLIDQEFKDYQIILFTHDLFWFRKIQRRFPEWITKKIKYWDYMAGPEIDIELTTEEEIIDLLKDSTKIDDAGFKLGKHVEGLLNEFCENIHAEIRYRYTRNDPPAMEELFEGFHKRLKSKLGPNHSILGKVLNAKKYEPVLRNFTAHPQKTSPASISPTEVKRAMEEWFKLEKELFCPNCNCYIEYIQSRKSIECRCVNGGIKLS